MKCHRTNIGIPLTQFHRNVPEINKFQTKFMLHASHDSPVNNASGCGMDDQDFIPSRANGFLQHVPLTSRAQPASYSIRYVNSSLLDYGTHLHDQIHLACINPFHIPLELLTLAPWLSSRSVRRNVGNNNKVTSALVWVWDTRGGWGTIAGRGWEAFSAISCTIKGGSSQTSLQWWG